MMYVTTSDAPAFCEADYASRVSLEGKRISDGEIYFKPLAKTPEASIFVDVDVEPRSPVGRTYDIDALHPSHP